MQSFYKADILCGFDEKGRQLIFHQNILKDESWDLRIRLSKNAISLIKTLKILVGQRLDILTENSVLFIYI